ncbi:MAG: tRNA adenosine(34) deaminase TadA [Chloroflexota bacterium]
MADDAGFMRVALAEAAAAFAKGEVPVGAILVADGMIVARGHNERESSLDPTAHAEVLVMRETCRKRGTWRLTDATLYVTKEPCVMCAGTMVNARLGRLVYGCSDRKGGAVVSLYHLLSDERLNHQVIVSGGLLEDECAALLRDFFSARRSRTTR